VNSEDISDIEVRLLLETIFEKYSYDFRGYAMTSVKRRLKTAITHFGAKTISALQERVLHEPSLFSALLEFLTVSTSEMFRDPHFFLCLRKEVVPILATYPLLKVWIAGCSTGEEVYSYAILLKEVGLLKQTMIYATDINPASLKKAENGIFPLEKIKEFTRNYQNAGGSKSFADYFATDSNAAIFDRSLRENVVFADHSLATDNVFSEMQLISCRNVMIYFEKELQNRALGLFYESLSNRGFLGIGAKETLRFSDYDSRFEAVSKEEKIYRRK